MTLYILGAALRVFGRSKQQEFGAPTTAQASRLVGRGGGAGVITEWKTAGQFHNSRARARERKKVRIGNDIQAVILFNIEIAM